MSLENILTENLLNGMKKSFNNAEELLSEAEILKSNKKWTRAYTLCQFAVEELAKVILLFNLWIDRFNDVPINYKKLNDNFTSHTYKIKLSTEAEISFFNYSKNKLELHG